ncbi:MAG: MerR family transcriptional regulator [Clostridiales bacterium]|nr:MerR family transcriptional regulator [Clostridiales bacterium]
MENKKYRIGDVAEMTGVSRDTIRYYEKRGFLPSRREENGYRYYTREDIARLVSILYQRRMNLPLDDMEKLWDTSIEGASIEQMPEMIESRIGREQEAIRFHEQVIARLKLSLEDCLNFCRHREKVRLEQFPAAYIIVPKVEKEQREELYMEYAHRYPGMDMMYTMEEYELDAQAGTPDIAYQDTSLILYQNQAEYVEGYSFPEKTLGLSDVSCVSLFQTSDETSPQPELVTDMLQWAAARDLTLSHKLYTMIAMHGVKDGNFVYYRKLYIPVVSSEKKEFLTDIYGRIAG